MRLAPVISRYGRVTADPPASGTRPPVVRTHPSAAAQNSGALRNVLSARVTAVLHRGAAPLLWHGARRQDLVQRFHTQRVTEVLQTGSYFCDPSASASWARARNSAGLAGMNHSP